VTTDVALMVYSMGGGGVERMRIHLAEALSRRGFATSIVVARSDGKLGLCRPLVPAGVKFVDFQAHSWLAWRNSFASYLDSDKPRVVLAAMETAGVIALWARHRTKAPTRIVVSSHVELSRHTKHGRRRWSYQKRLVLPYLMKRLYRHADGVVAVSHGVADDLARFAQLPRQAIRVINNPVVTDRLLEAKRPLPDHPWLTDRSIPLILGVGRLTEQKDFATLLKAFALIRERRPARLMILGEGEERGKLAALIASLGLEDHVQMPGFVANPFTYMARSSVFALSSLWEGLPGVVIQALACGCPVVSTDCAGGVREILEDDKHGRLVPIGDEEAMAQAITATLDDPPSREMLLRRASDFHVDKIIPHYLDVLGLT
jgi:glycosyltransferase involved in cell wall biosynthesis